MLIKQLEEDIERHKKEANSFISGIVKTTGVSIPTENEHMDEDQKTTTIEEVLVKVAVEDPTTTPIVIEDEYPTTPIIEEVHKHNKSMKKLKFKVKILDDE
jgi:hypothetical protein